MSARGLQGAAEALRDGHDGLLDAWLSRFARSVVRLPGSIDPAMWQPMLAPVAEALAEALAAPAGEAAPAIHPGSAALREVEQRLSFLGARLAARGGSGFDAAALLLALRDAVTAYAADEVERAQTHGLFDWFSALMFEAFTTGARDAARERTRELLEDRAAVVCVRPELPAAFPLADERGAGVEPVLARLALLSVRVGARCAIIDASGLVDPQAPPVLEAVGRFFGHSRVAGRLRVVAVGLRPAELRIWRSLAREHDVAIEGAETFLDAVKVSGCAPRDDS